MQRSLFADGYQAKIAYQASLAGFDLPGARENLRKLGRTVDAPADLTAKLSALETLQAMVETGGSRDSAFLAAFVQRLDMHGALAPLQSDLNHIRSGLMRRLASLIDPSQTVELACGLHPAEVLLEAGLLAQAVDLVYAAVAQLGEDARLRQIQSRALAEQKKRSEALGCLSLALFFDPERCEERFLPPDGDIEREWRALKPTLTRQGDAWPELTWRLWQAGILKVNDAAPAFEALLLTKTAALEMIEAADGSERLAHFNRLLYVVEAMRRRSAAAEDMEPHRAHMKTLCPEKYSQYLAWLSSDGARV
jgi:hypothetical protein